MVRYWSPYHVLTVMCMKLPTRWLRYLPCEFSSCFNYSSIRGLLINIFFINYVYTVKVTFWNFTSYICLFPNVLVLCSWWYDMYNQYWWHFHFGWCWYWGDSVLTPPGRCSQIVYQILASVFKSKSGSMLLLGYHMFQL